MNNKRRLLRKQPHLSTPPVETLLSQWLKRALADEQGRNFLRAALRQHELPVIEMGTPSRSKGLSAA